MWPDIEKVSLFSSTSARVETLPRTQGRLNASLFLGGHSPFEWEYTKPDQDTMRRIRSILVWASVVALSSAREMLTRDLHDIGLDVAWRSSAQRGRLIASPLLAVLHELRNYEVHLEFREGNIRDHDVWVGSPGSSEAKHYRHPDAYFFSPIEFSELARLHNISDGRSLVTSEMVQWFSRQAATWPAVYLVGEARDLFVFHVDEFLATTMPS